MLTWLVGIDPKFKLAPNVSSMSGALATARMSVTLCAYMFQPPYSTAALEAMHLALKW